LGVKKGEGKRRKRLECLLFEIRKGKRALMFNFIDL
jgi:hypothetical protein